MQLMLPVAAVMTADPPYKQGEPWSLVHSACLVSCPAAMLHVALKWNPQRITPSKGLEAGGIRHIYTRIKPFTTHWRLSGNSNSKRPLLFTTFYPFPEVCRATDKKAAAAYCH
jgi:hypothetical protein